MFGIQWTQVNHDQFFISLYAGLLANIVTAIIGGLIVWFIISQIDMRRLRRLYEREVAGFREKLRFALDKFDVTYLDSIANPPFLAGILASELKEYPISVWQENVPKGKELFAAIEAFQRTYSEFMVAANKLQMLVQNLIRYFNGAQQAQFRTLFADSEYEKYLLGKILGMEDKEILLWLGRHEELLPIFEEANNAILSQEQLQEPQITYRILRKELELAVSRVKEELNP